MHFQKKFFFHAPNGNATHAYCEHYKESCAYLLSKLQVTRIRSFLCVDKTFLFGGQAGAGMTHADSPQVRYLPKCVITDEKGNEYETYIYEGETYLKLKECAENA